MGLEYKEIDSNLEEIKLNNHPGRIKIHYRLNRYLL